MHAVASHRPVDGGFGIRQECKEGDAQTDPSDKFNGLRTGRDSWWKFIGQEISLGLQQIEHFREISLSVL